MLFKSSKIDSQETQRKVNWFSREQTTAKRRWRMAESYTADRGRKMDGRKSYGAGSALNGWTQLHVCEFKGTPPRVSIGLCQCGRKRKR